MEIVTKKMLIASIADRWERNYYHRFNNKWAMAGLSSSLEIYEALCKLNPPTEKAIAEIIGNDSWTKNECDECEKDYQIVVQVGRPPGHESTTANICLNCLEKAVKLAKNKKI